MRAILVAVALGACTPAEPVDEPVETVAPDGEAQAQEPELALLTTLPILFGETFSADAPASPLREVLEDDYRLRAIAVTSGEELAGVRLLLMAHPQAQPPEALVALDDWVRGGGRVLLTADPRFGPEEGVNLGGRPPFFADTGLLARWGLALDGPLTMGAATATGEAGVIEATAPGRFEPRETDTGDRCTLEVEGFIADCVIGDGRALIVADSDWLMAEGAAGETNRATLRALLGRLAD